MATLSSISLSQLTPPKHDVSNENITKASDELFGLLGSERIVSSLEERRNHSITKWSPAAPSQFPALNVLPTSTADVSAIMKIFSRRPIPVTGFCGGSSFPGAIAATRGGLCIDFKRMNKVLAVHSEDMDVVAQPALGWEDLNAQLGDMILFFPPDPGPGAKIGGMVSIYRSHRAYRASAMTVVTDCYELF